MRTVKWNAFLSGLCGFAVVLGVVTASAARADVTTEKGASILIFPKVLADGTFDTVIQIANTGNSMVHAHCFYVAAQLANSQTHLPCRVPSSVCVPECSETDFDIWLTKQQPTHWVVSKGRSFNPTDNYTGNLDGAGFDPGLVPAEGCDGMSNPCGSPFQGELKCVEVSETDEPITGNHLKGEATLEAVQSAAGNGINNPGATKGDLAKYNAIGILGNPDATPSSNVLPLDGNTYDACPSRLIVNHFSSGASDPVVDAATAIGATGFTGVTSSVSTELTLVPCQEDLENQNFTKQTLDFTVYNEFEQPFSTSTTVNCYLSTELTNIDSGTSPARSIFSRNILGTDVAHTEIVPVPNNDATQSIHAVIGVAARAVTVKSGSSGVTARAAYDLHSVGSLIPANGPPDELTVQLLNP
jgi:hypothetical protein